MHQGSRATRLFRIVVLWVTQLTWVALAWGGIRMFLAGTPAVGLIFLVAAAVTAFLALRRLAAGLRAPVGDPTESMVTGPAVDYAVWTLVILPILLVVAVLIAVLTSDIR